MDCIRFLKMTVINWSGLALASVLVIAKVCTTILTPLWVDSENGESPRVITFSINATAYPIVNMTSTSGDSFKHVDAYAMVLIVSIAHTLFCGAVVAGTMIFKPGVITSFETSYPKMEFLKVGLSTSIGSLLNVYASSGRRSPPYLLALLQNFSVPIVFIVRFIILKKRPTSRKLVCAGIVLVSLFISLLPSIFPQLETEQAHQDNGGSEGIGRFLWPLCFVLGYVPDAVMYTIGERTVKYESLLNETKMRINIFYFLFWSNLTCSLFVICAFWTDLIPGFGTVSNIGYFPRTLWFNIECLVSASDCSDRVVPIAWSCMTCLLIGRLFFFLLIRHSEGANYATLIITLQTPVVFLFWTLFVEDPFHWYPHAHLSTWLSIGAMCFMLPAIYMYNTGPPEITVPYKGIMDAGDVKQKVAVNSDNETTALISHDSLKH